MIDNIKMDQVQKLFTDETFVTKFNTLEEFAEIKDHFSENGLDFSDEELKEFITAVVKAGEQKESGELSEEQMEDIVGGSWTAALIIGGVCAVVTGTSMYKLRKLIGC